MKNQQLIVPVDPNLVSGIKPMLVIWLIPISLLAGCYGVVSFYLTGIPYYLLSFFLVGPLILMSLMFLLLIWGAFLLPKKDEPVAILNQDGIWLARFGFISWKEIDEFASYSYQGTPEVIGIRVKNNEKISKQSSIAGKLDFFWAKLMGYPPIRITGIALENDEVINFAIQFLRS
ncbi:hypothetical protein ACFLXW_00340 [Candidatus Dependentiae bacterium]